MSTPESGQLNTTFHLSDSEGRISGSLTLSSTGGGDPVTTESLIGTVDTGIVNIETEFYDAQNNPIRVGFNGSVMGDTFSGSVSITDGTVTESGTFSVARGLGHINGASEGVSPSEEGLNEFLQHHLAN